MPWTNVGRSAVKFTDGKIIHAYVTFRAGVGWEAFDLTGQAPVDRPIGRFRSAQEAAEAIAGFWNYCAAEPDMEL